MPEEGDEKKSGRLKRKRDIPPSPSDDEGREVKLLRCKKGPSEGTSNGKK